MFPRAILSCLAAAVLAGCVVAPPSAVVVDPGGVIVAPVAPPPLVVEPVLVAPSPLHIWIGGYWSWHGGRHVWTRGHWAAPPPGHRHWVPRQWVPGPGGWHQRGGHWAR
ncbi:MAG TPA: hypothetical protein VGE20_19785 [Ramlibacter sp.]